MLARIGESISRAFRALMPDPFVLAILLTLLTFALGLLVTASSPADMLRHWQGRDGFWRLLAFGMQMCLILVTGHALASAPLVARALHAVARLPRTGPQAAWLVSSLAIASGLVNWGLGLIVGATLARAVGLEMKRRAIPVPYALLAAAGYTGLMTWHGGLSGSAPLTAANPEDFARSVGPEIAALCGGAIPLSRTVFALPNLIITGGLLVLVPVLFALMCPRSAPHEPPPATNPPSAPTTDDHDAGAAVRWLERSPVVVWALAIPMFIWLGQRLAASGVDALDLNTANLLFLSLGLVLHGSARGYVASIEDAARGCAGIILQFPLYAGIIGMMEGSGLVAAMSRWFVSAAGGNDSALQGLMFASAGLVNIFVPSGGGQWAIQGPIALRAALDAGADPARFVMAVAYGDQWTNMIQPFWALPLLAITGARARDIVGYTAIAMVVGGLWIALWLVLL